MAEVKPAIETFAKIKVIGAGGSGGSAVNRMIRSKIKGVEFIAANTDVQALQHSHAPTKIHLGKTVTRGLGAGMNPEIGRQAAEESQNEIRDALKGSDMVFITCGLGGGTGSGSAPVIAEIARDCGALTVAVVTKPFSFEGGQRRDIADRAYEELSQHVDTIITIPNDRVLEVIDKKTSLLDAFETVDDVLRQGVQGISELITVPGMINVDFADVRAIMNETGSALMGIGRASGENRATVAAKAAISSPLLDVSIDGAKGVLFTVTGGTNLSMFEVAEVGKVINEQVGKDAKVIFGAIIDETLKDEIKVSVIATGFDGTDRVRAAERHMVDSGFVSQNRAIKREVPAAEPKPVMQSKPFNRTAPAPAPVATVPVAQDVAPAPVAAEVVEEAPVATAPAPAPVPVQAPAAQSAPFIRRVMPTAAAAPAPVAAAPAEDLDVPSFYRRKQPATAPAMAGAPAEEDLEIPAFIRRKMQ